MKKFTLKSALLTGVSFLALTTQAQNLGKIQLQKSSQPVKATNKSLVMQPEGTFVLPQAKVAAANTCTDMINSAGNTVGPYAAIGSNSNSASPWEIAVLQVYPAYTGEVLGVEFTGEKFSTAGNPKVYVAIFDLVGGVPDENTQQPPSAPFVTVNSSTTQQWTHMFASPIQVTNGFAVGVFCLGSDSARIHSGPVLPSQAPYYSYVYTSTGNMVSFNNYFGVDADLLLKPIIKTNAEATWLTAKTSTGCSIPAVYGFTNTSSTWPSYINNSVINPSGVSMSLDYGDNTPVATAFPFNNILTHSYTAIGTYTASFTRKYTGWMSNCEATETIVVNVDNPQPSFTYNTNGLTVMFTNTSQGMNNYNWNFGDLSTSNQTNPSHTFSSPGTYVVELEGTAPCGTVKYTQSIVVTVGVGIKENGSSSNLVRLFPNPAANALTISTPAKDELSANVEIFNSVGASVQSLTLNELNSGTATIDISSLSKGVYFIKLKHRNGDIVKSFVKE